MRVNNNLRELLGDFSFQIDTNMIGKLNKEKKKKFGNDLWRICQEENLRNLIEEAEEHIKEAIQKKTHTVVRETDGEKIKIDKVVIIDCENVFHSSQFNIDEMIEMIIGLINKGYFVFLIKHRFIELSNFKSQTSGEQKRKITQYTRIIEKGDEGSFLDDFFIILLSVIAKKSGEYKYPSFMTKRNVDVINRKIFKKSFKKCKKFLKGSSIFSEAENSDRETKKLFIDNLKNVELNHPNNFIISLDKFTWLKFSNMNSISMFSQNNNAGPAPNNRETNINRNE